MEKHRTFGRTWDFYTVYPYRWRERTPREVDRTGTETERNGMKAAIETTDGRRETTTVKEADAGASTSSSFTWLVVVDTESRRGCSLRSTRATTEAEGSPALQRETLCVWIRTNERTDGRADGRESLRRGIGKTDERTDGRTKCARG